jgi:hypothetical protein
MDFSRGQYVIYGPVRIILTENEVQGQYNHNRFILIDYYMNGPRSIYIFNVNNQRLLHDIFHIDLVLARNAHTKPDSEAGGLVYILQTISNVIVQIGIVWYIFETRLETKIFAS